MLWSPGLEIVGGTGVGCSAAGVGVVLRLVVEVVAQGLMLSTAEAR